MPSSISGGMTRPLSAFRGRGLRLCAAAAIALVLAASVPLTTGHETFRYHPYEGPWVYLDTTTSVVPSTHTPAATKSAAPEPSGSTHFPATVSGARSFARQRIGATQFRCLDALWERESGWRTTARNKNSGAYGIPQALPGSKMAKAGADWRTNPVTQVKWGLMYIGGRYGSACNAWSFFKRNGWY